MTLEHPENRLALVHVARHGALKVHPGKRLYKQNGQLQQG
jgi:hypothetical protein